MPLIKLGRFILDLKGILEKYYDRRAKAELYRKHDWAFCSQDADEIYLNLVLLKKKYYFYTSNCVSFNKG
jgi:hypothetical protein